MSLDVYLETDVARMVGVGIFIRENGGTKEISREEWDARFPNREPAVVAPVEGETTNTVYTANVTHNLNKMAGEAAIYEALWRPDEIGITKAAQLIEPLRDGLAKLRAEPERYRAFNPENGWGSYEGLVAFVADYLAACEQNPDATVKVWR